MPGKVNVGVVVREEMVCLYWERNGGGGGGQW